MAAPIYVLGGYQTDFARNWNKENKHIVALLREAVIGGLEATGIEPKDVEVGHVGNFAAELYAMQGHLGAFLVDIDPCFSGLPTSRHEAACASGSIAILAASAEIEAGRYDLALVAGVEQMKTVDPTRGADFLGTAAWYDREAKGIEFPFPKLFGRLGDEYDKRFGSEGRTPGAHLGHQLLQRQAQPAGADAQLVHDRGPRLRATDKFNSVIGGRIKSFRLLAGHRRRRVALPGLGESGGSLRQEAGREARLACRACSAGDTTPRPSSSTPRSRRAATIAYVLPHTRQSHPRRLPPRRHPRRLRRVKAIETHDCFTTSEYMAIDHFGLTKPGESWKAIEDGTIEMGRQDADQSRAAA